MKNTYLHVGNVNGYHICTMTKDLCKERDLPYPCFYVLTEQNAPTLSPEAAIHFSPDYIRTVSWCSRQPSQKLSTSSCFIIVTYRFGRNATNDILWFDSRESATEYGKSVLDKDTLVNRYTIYDL